MITGYASIDSAVKATKLGASHYLPKPFTPDELSEVTEKALLNRKEKIAKPKVEKREEKEKLSNEDIDVDMPFSEAEVAKATSKDYVEALTHSDIPLAKKVVDKVYCYTGKRECRRLALQGRECPNECPIEAKERARAKTITRVTRPTKDLIDADIPFSISEVEKYTGADYINCLDRSDMPRAALYGKDATAKHSVLVVDDEPIVCHSVRRILSKQSCSVEEAFDVDAALQKMKLHKYDLVILDLSLPDMDGQDVLKSLREWTNIPVIILSVRENEKDKVEALDAGADDYLTKPFGVGELMARIRAALRHAESTPESGSVMEMADLRIDFMRRVVELRGSEIQLTPTEYELLKVLVQNAGKVLTHHHLLQKVWGTGYQEDAHLLRVNISNLRRKIEDDPANPRYIQTESAVGYRFLIDPH
jgi:two-component system KDP operon response regulator KdpE